MSGISNKMLIEALQDLFPEKEWHLEEFRNPKKSFIVEFSILVLKFLHGSAIENRWLGEDEHIADFIIWDSIKTIYATACKGGKGDDYSLCDFVTPSGQRALYFTKLLINFLLYVRELDETKVQPVLVKLAQSEKEINDSTQRCVDMEIKISKKEAEADDLHQQIDNLAKELSENEQIKKDLKQQCANVSSVIDQTKATLNVANTELNKHIRYEEIEEKEIQQLQFEIMNSDQFIEFEENQVLVQEKIVQLNQITTELKLDIEKSHNEEIFYTELLNSINIFMQAEKECKNLHEELSNLQIQSAKEEDELDIILKSVDKNVQDVNNDKELQTKSFTQLEVQSKEIEYKLNTLDTEIKKLLTEGNNLKLKLKNIERESENYSKNFEQRKQEIEQKFQELEKYQENVKMCISDMKSKLISKQLKKG